jgi:iron(III) transport system substrate-binding protein
MDFEKQTGIKVKPLFDTEETKSTGVLNRLIAEKDNPQCDVFWSGDPVRAIILKNKDITTPYNSPVSSAIEAYFKDKAYHWTGFSARARVLIYNTNFLSSEDVPHSIFDLVKEKYKGQVAIANPLFGTTSFHFASWFSVLGDSAAENFLKDLKDNQVVIATSNGDVKKRVTQGEVWCGLTDSDDAFTAKNEGAPMDYLFLDQQNLGNLIIPNTVSLIKGSPNSENGRKLIDYLLSRETEAKLAVSCAQMPLHKGIRTADNIPSLDDILPMKIDYDKTAWKLESRQNYFKDWVENK